jgi:hypothetical protein
MCISKISGGGGGVYLGGEFHRRERELQWPDDEIALVAAAMKRE